MSKAIKWISGIIVVVAVSLVLVFTGSNKTPDEEKPIKIGAAFGLSGDTAVWGEASLNAAKLAVNDLNAKGGINGRKVELVVEDMKSTSRDAVLAISKLRDVEHVDAYMITWLDVYQGAESLLPDGKIMISPDAGTEAVNGTTIHPRVFSTWYRTQPKAELEVQHMAHSGKKTLAILVQKDPYYEGMTNFIKEAAKKYDIEVVDVQTLNPDSDMKAVLPKIAANKPDAVFFSFYDQRLNSEFLKRQKAFLDNTTAIYGDELVQQAYESSDYSKELFEGMYFYTPKKPDSKFFDQYVSTYKINPVFGAAPTYDSVMMIAEMLHDNPTDIDSYMRSRIFDTVSYGKVTFDKIGGVTTPKNYFTMKQFRDGVPVDLK